MERIIRNNNGITLIALVISIIVMLILAGVSINAVVGDNGVISKAQDTVFLNSCAYLEEYFNQLYATCAIDGAEEGDTPLHTIMKSGYQNYFFSTSEGACLKKVVINEETGTNQTIVLYLVKKEQLPGEIQAQLTGAEDLESRDYRKLRGCYGITSDLKAYYCENGLDTIMGLTKDDLNADSPDIVFADENSVLANVVNGGTAPVTNQGLKTIKRLTIDSVEELSLLADFSRFINLTEVYFSGIEIPNLVGIEGAADSITYVKFTSCNVQDYSAMNSLSKLTQLYLVQPVGMDEEIARLGSSDKGIASGEFSKLQYFGIVGSIAYLNSSTTDYSTTRYGITDVSSLSNFSDITKKAIKYMNLQNLQLTSIASLEEFTNVYLLRAECNALTTFQGIQNMSGLKYLIAPNQYSNTTSSYTLGINEGDSASETDALSYIYKNSGNNSTLYYVDLRTNSSIKYVDSLGECTAIRYLYMAGCTNIQNASTMANTIGNCGVNMSLSSNYTLDVISETAQTVDLSNQTISLATLESLENCTNLWRLNLQNIKLTDETGTVITDAATINTELNETLSKLTNMKHLKLYGISNLSTLDFIGENKVTKLYELDLRNTNVTEISCLNDYAKNLQSILLNNASIDLTTIQPTISRFTQSGWSRGVNYWSNGDGGGLMLDNANLYKSLENCTEITQLQCATRTYTYPYVLDMSNCKKISWVHGRYVNGIKLSSSVTSFTTWTVNSGKLDFSEASNLKRISIESLNVGTDYYLESFTNKCLKYCYSLESLNFSACSTIKGFKGFENLDSSINYPLKNLSYTSWSSWIMPAIDLTGIENYKNLSTFNMYNTNTANISPLALCLNLENLNISNNKITDISSLATLKKLNTLTINNNTQLSNIIALANCTELTSLNVNNCSIADVYPLMSCTKLETLNIQNNALTDFGYHTDSSGRTIGYEVMDVFYDLNHAKQGSLKNLYISGNTFDDTEILLDLTWEGRSGF